MWMLDDWHDWFRLVGLLICVYTLAILASRSARFRSEWNTKTRDLWFALVMWTLTGVALAVEGVVEDRPLEPRLVFYFIASVIGLKGIIRKGSWGGHDH